ncbi:MAG TPA: hypothetical protein VFA75_00340 [Nevskia sp.]|nr:hypothetical protein [Nevskia sp.]
MLATGKRLAQLQQGSTGLGFYGALLGRALDERLITRDDANALLARSRDEGLQPLAQAINGGLHRRVMDLVARSPFPLGDRTEKQLNLPGFGVWYETTVVHTWDGWHAHDLARLRRASPAVRSWVWQQVNMMPLPVVDTLAVHETHYYTDGVSQTLRRLAARAGEPREAAIHAAFVELLKLVDFDQGDNEEPYHYGVGSEEEFRSFVKSVLPMFRRRRGWLLARPPAKAPAPSNAAEARWIDFGQRAAQLRGWFRQNAIMFPFDSEEQRPLVQAHLLALDAHEFDIACTFFDRIEDGSGEVPGVSFDLRQSGGDGTLVNFALLPVIIASAMAQLDELCEGKKHNA